MKNCIRCGYKIESADTFCMYCGCPQNEPPPAGIQPRFDLPPTELVSDAELDQGLGQPDYAEQVYGTAAYGNGYMSPNGPQMTLPPQPKKPKSKKFLVPIIISLVLLVLAAGVWFIVQANKTASVDGLMKEYQKAYNDLNNEKLLELSFPKANRNISVDAEKAYIRVDNDNPRINKIDIVDQMEILDAELQEVKDTYQECFGFYLDSDNVKLLTLGITYSGDTEPTTLYMYIYKIKSKWYLMPGIFSVIEKKHQDADIFKGKELYTAVDNALYSTQESYDCMNMYRESMISFEDDMEYLPTEFQTALKNELTDDMLKLSYIKGGATGYAFKITEDANIQIYISSYEKYDQWMIYPSIDESYYDGLNVPVASATDASKERYSFVKLTSEQSPILGYWQADNAGMYIGYSESGCDEGFTIYFSYSSHSKVIHPLANYTCQGNGNTITMTSPYEEEPNLTLTVVDDKTIQVHAEKIYDSKAETCVTKDFTFNAKSNFEGDLYDPYLGAWVADGFPSFGGTVVNYDGMKHILYSTEEELAYAEQPFITLYDGSAFTYIYTRGQFYNPDNGITYYISIYTLEGENELFYDYGLIGGGGGESFHYYRQGTEKAATLECLAAYQEIVNQVQPEKVCLFYLDNDSIPEMLLRPSGSLVTYKDGQAIVCEEYMPGDLASCIYYYGPGASVIQEKTDMGVYGYNYTDNHLVECLFYSWFHADPDAPDVYKVDGQDTDEATYNAAVQSKGFANLTELPSYNSLNEAYENLN